MLLKLSLIFFILRKVSLIDKYERDLMQIENDYK